MKETESLASLKFDTRLRRRKGWVTDEDVDQHLASLPDVSSRIQADDAEEEGEGGAAPSSSEQEPPGFGPAGGS